jgi:hypothetical protein
MIQVKLSKIKDQLILKLSMITQEFKFNLYIFPVKIVLENKILEKKNEINIPIVVIKKMPLFNMRPNKIAPKKPKSGLKRININIK